MVEGQGASTALICATVFSQSSTLATASFVTLEFPLPQTSGSGTVAFSWTLSLSMSCDAAPEQSRDAHGGR